MKFSLDDSMLSRFFFTFTRNHVIIKKQGENWYKQYVIIIIGVI